MSQTLILIAAVIVAAAVGYAVGRARGRGALDSQGRLTLDSQATTTSRKLAVSSSSSTSPAVADAVESTLDPLPVPEVTPQPGVHVSIKTNVKRIFKLPNKDVAEAVAERERAKGMSVVVTPPDATDQTWRVTSTK